MSRTRLELVLFPMRRRFLHLLGRHQHKPPYLLLFFLLFFESLICAIHKAISIAIAYPLDVIGLISMLLVFLLDFLYLCQNAIHSIFENRNANLQVILKADEAKALGLAAW